MTIIKQRALVLRTCKADMTSHSGFVWPESGPVECPDWKPTVECGNGLHGALWGDGDGNLLSWEPDAKWLVAEVQEYIDLKGKVKFPATTVLFCGDRKGATDFIIAHGATGAVIGATVTAGDYGTASAGDRGTLQIRWHDGSRHRIATAYVGENGIKPNTPYRLNGKGEFVECKA